MDSARELAKLLERDAELLVRLGQELVGVVRVSLLQLRLREPQGDRHGDEPLLGAVVEISLEPPPLIVAGRTPGGPRRSQLPRASSFASASEIRRVKALSLSSAPGGKSLAS